METNKTISAENEISMFYHCKQCVAELPSDGTESPETWARLSIGHTPIGLQIWCVRHNCNVAHIDFEGEKHPANMLTKEVEDALLAKMSEINTSLHLVK